MVKEAGLMTVKEAADYLGVSRFKMARLIRDGEIATFVTPLDRRRKLIRRTDLDELRVRVRPAPEGIAEHDNEGGVPPAANRAPRSRRHRR